MFRCRTISFKNRKKQIENPWGTKVYYYLQLLKTVKNKLRIRGNEVYYSRIHNTYSHFLFYIFRIGEKLKLWGINDIHKLLYVIETLQDYYLSKQIPYN